VAGHITRWLPTHRWSLIQVLTSTRPSVALATCCLQVRRPDDYTIKSPLCRLQTEVTKYSLKNSFYLDQVNTESVNNNANNKHRPNNKVVTYTNLNQPYNSNTADAMHRMSPGAVDPRKTDADTSVAAAAAAVAVFSGSE